MTEEQALEDFRVPEKIQPLAIHGRRMRGLGADLAEIERLADRYCLKLLDSAFSSQGGGPGVEAARILTGHVTAAAAAGEMIRAGTGGSGPSDRLLGVHLRQQSKECSCGKPGFRDLSFAALDQQGWATVEYKCIFCGNSDSFRMDHSH